MKEKNSWELLMEYNMFVIAGAVGGFVLLISLDEQTMNFTKPFLIVFYLLLGFLSYYLFYKASIRNK